MVIDLGDTGRTIAFWAYCKSLKAAGVSHLIEKYDLEHIAGDASKMKMLSEWAKKRGEQADEHWRFLVDLHRLSDYLPYPEEKDFYDDIKDWVTRKPLHTWNGDEEKWYEIFEETARKVILGRGKKPREVKTLDWFVNNSDVWCTAGSGFEPDAEKLKIYDKKRDQEETVRKNKWSVRWSMSTSKIKRLILKRRPQICKAVAKSEPGKVRAVVSSDLSLYLKMSFVSMLIDKYFSGREDSTLFMNDEQRSELWQSFALDGTWRMPLDQSEFDKNQTKRQVLIIVKIIEELVHMLTDDQDYHKVMQEIIYAISGGVVFVDGRSVPYENGVLSGWRWTALIDTLINLTEANMAERWVRENSMIKIKLLALNAQGDDDWLKFDTRREAIAFWLAYESFGLAVNPGKFFLSKTRDEYLRRVLVNNVLTGYPARSITSICFRSPLSDREGVGAERVRAVFNRWKLLAERMDADFENSRFWSLMLDDATQGLKGSTHRDIENYANLGARFGGIGVTRNFADVRIPSSTVPEPHPLEIMGAGYKDWLEWLAPYSPDERIVNRFVTSTLDLNGKFSVPRWVKHIFSTLEIDTKVPVTKFDGQYIHGSVFVGSEYRYLALKYRARYFDTFGDLTHLTKWTDLEWERPIYRPIYRTDALQRFVNPVRPEVIDELTQTAANMTEAWDLVYKQNFDFSILDHKPKSWVKDFLSGKLKPKMSVFAGWGVDAVGSYAKQFLGAAIHRYLHTKAPSLVLWDSLLAKIDVTVQDFLRTLPVRVVE